MTIHTKFDTANTNKCNYITTVTKNDDAQTIKCRQPNLYYAHIITDALSLNDANGWSKN